MAINTQFQLGEELQAQVIEVLDTQEIVLRIFANQSTELVRVANESGISLKRGDKVRLRVTAVHPPRFQYLKSSLTLKESGHIDVSI